MQDGGQWWLMSKMRLWWAPNCRDNNSCFRFFQQSEISSPTPSKGSSPFCQGKGNRKRKIQQSTADDKSLCCWGRGGDTVMDGCPWPKEWIPLVVLAAQSKGPGWAEAWLPLAWRSMRRPTSSASQLDSSWSRYSFLPTALLVVNMAVSVMCQGHGILQFIKRWTFKFRWYQWQNLCFLSFLKTSEIWWKWRTASREKRFVPGGGVWELFLPCRFAKFWGRFTSWLSALSFLLSKF